MYEHRMDSWILESIREPLQRWLSNEVLRDGPLPSDADPLVKKTALLRRIGSDLPESRLSEELLETLEQIEEIDRSLGVEEPSAKMKTAYCALAVECTLMRLWEGGGARDPPAGFLEAVERIWRRRVERVCRSAPRGLYSRQLRGWCWSMERAAESSEVRGRLMRSDTRREALESLRDYLMGAMKEMGPALLQLAARTINRNGDSSASGEKRGGGNGATSERRAPDGESDCSPSEIDTERTPRVQETETRLRGHASIVQSWNDDSLESPSKKSAIPSPREQRVSHLKVKETTKFVKRRKSRRWTPQEERTLKEAVEKLGIGEWKHILDCYPEKFKDRTKVDLKDKWRNMIG